MFTNLSRLIIVTSQVLSVVFALVYSWHRVRVLHPEG